MKGASVRPSKYSSATSSRHDGANGAPRPRGTSPIRSPGRASRRAAGRPGSTGSPGRGGRTPCAPGTSRSIFSLRKELGRPRSSTFGDRTCPGACSVQRTARSRRPERGAEIDVLQTVRGMACRAPRAPQRRRRWPCHRRSRPAERTPRPRAPARGCAPFALEFMATPPGEAQPAPGQPHALPHQREDACSSPCCTDAARFGHRR